MSPLLVAVIVYFDVLHLVRERSREVIDNGKYSKENTQNSQENTCVGAPTYQFNSQSMG